jgi:chromosome segregation ATPase
VPAAAASSTILATTAAGAVGGNTGRANAAAKAALDAVGSPKRTMGATAAPTAQYRNMTVQDIINDWKEKLESLRTSFTNEAVKVSKWDRELVANQEVISKLADEVQHMKMEQEDLNGHVETIDYQQQELEATLEHLEQQVDVLFEQQAARVPDDADLQREQMYTLALELDQQLGDVSRDLKGIVTGLNENYDRQMGSDNAFAQVLQILNVHHNSLQWLDTHGASLEHEVANVAQQLRR